MAASVQDVIMLLGDSLTQGASIPYGFAQRLSYLYNRKLDVLNRGLSGYNTTWGFKIFRQCIAKHSERAGLPKVRLLTIWFGANDACLPGSDQHVPLPIFSDNLSRIIRLVSAPSSEYFSPETKILLLTPPPVNTHQRGADLSSRTPSRDLDRSFKVTEQYAQAVRDVAKQEGVPLVDVFTILWEGCGKEERKLSKYLTDGLHVNEEAYGLIYDEILRSIDVHYPELQADKLKMVFPPWDEIDPKNPDSDLQKRIDLFPTI